MPAIRRRALAAASLLLVLGASRTMAAVVARGSERVVNTTAAGHQLRPAVAALDNGRTVVAWIGIPGSDHWRTGWIYGRILTAEGTPEGPERVLWAPPQPPYHLTSVPAVAADRDGGFLLAWSQRDGLGLGSAPDHFLMAQSFDSLARPRAAARRVATLPGGGETTVAVARLAQGDHLLLYAGALGGATGHVLRLPPGDGPGGAPLAIGSVASFSPPAVAPLAGGGFAIAWVGSGPLGWDAYVQTFDDHFHPVFPARPLSERPSTGRRVVALAPAGSGFAAAWFEEPHWENAAQVEARLFGADGTPRGEPFTVAAAEESAEGAGLAVTSDAAGNFAVVFGQELATPVNYRVVARAFDALGHASGDVVPLGDHPSSGGVRAAMAGGGQLVAVWDSGQPAICDPFGCTTEGLDGNGASISARGATLALQQPLLVDGQFRVWVESGAGVPLATGAALSSDSAVFRFADPGNVEVVAKLVDGSGLNGRTWLFTAGMTSLAHTLVVRHEASGSERRYRSIGGRLRSVADTRGLPAGDWPAVVTLPAGGQDLALGGGRFTVALDWSAGPGQPVQRAQARALGDQSGVFWFYDPANPELLVKVLDGRGVNGHFWVFAGGLSGVAYTLTVTDRETGAVRTWQHAAGAPASFADTAAF
jgi:hypothetical protein